MRDQIANRIIIVILVLSGQGRARRIDRPAFADDAAFEFGQGDDVEHQRATGRGGVDRLGQRAQADAALADRPDRLDQLLGRASRPSLICGPGDHWFGCRHVPAIAGPAGDRWRPTNPDPPIRTTKRSLMAEALPLLAALVTSRLEAAEAHREELPPGDPARFVLVEDGEELRLCAAQR